MIGKNYLIKDYFKCVLYNWFGVSDFRIYLKWFDKESLVFNIIFFWNFNILREKG